MNDALITKLQKLLALAGNNPSQGEAEAAMAKAQALALENGIDLAMIGNAEDDSNKVVMEGMSFGQRLPTVNTYVTSILAEFFNVKLLFTGNRELGRGLIFIGKRDDIHTAKYIYRWLADTMVRCWHTYYHTISGVKLAQKQSYLYGFYHGLQLKLKANKQTVFDSKLTNDDSRQKYALACVNLEQRMTDFINAKFGDSVKKQQKKTIDVDPSSYSKGVNDGSNCNIAKGELSGTVAGALAAKL